MADKKPRVPALLAKREPEAKQSAAITLGAVLLDINAVKAKMGWRSDSTPYEYIRRHGFPAPKKAGKHSAARWLLSEVDEYIARMPRSEIQKEAA